MSAKQSITILHLYANEMNIYGDRGNILALTRRLEWRGYGVDLIIAGIDEKAPIATADIIFGGGGQDRGQVAVGHDLQRHAKALHKAADAGVPMLTICGTYQLFGRDFTTLDGEVIPGIGIFKARTVGSTLRMIGNEIISTPFGNLVGFENHSGRTVLEADQQAFGEVSQGHGNDDISGFEGSVYRNVFGTYLHGPILPKNPTFTDHLILTSLKRKYDIKSLKPLNDHIEEVAAADAARRPQ